MRTSTQLPPEFEKASKIASKRIEYVKNNRNLIASSLTNQIWIQTGNMAQIKYKPKIREIPSGEGWRWNQAKRRYIVTFDKTGTTMELTKLVPRKAARSTLSSLPKLKIWQASVIDKRFPLTVFWCEKGEDALSILPEIELDDLSFLAPFMEEEEGKLLWPSLPMYSEKNTNNTNIMASNSLPCSYEIQSPFIMDDSFIDLLLG